MKQSFYPIDLNRLPPPDVVDTPLFENILTERRASLISLWPEEEREEISARVSLESDPLHKLLQENAYRELMLRQRINDAARATLLAYAEKNDLEQVAAATNIERLVVRPATNDAPAIMESDDLLRRRAQFSWEGLTTAGSKGSYIYHALSADGKVADAESVSPSPAVVDVVIQSTEGDGAADAELLEAVRQYFSHIDRTPVADLVTIVSAEIVPYEVNAEIYLRGTGAEKAPIIEAATARLQELTQQQNRIGIDVTESAVHAALHVEGVAKVHLIGWADIQLTQYQAAYCAGITLQVIDP